MEESKLKHWHDRGYLPHFDGGEICQFITFGLADSVPAALVKRWKQALETEDDDGVKLELYRKIEKYLDKNYGNCYLRNSDIADTFVETLKNLMTF